ncbi:MAG: AAA family ATPase [Spirochaetia bacterium]|nr:AAA family ATPase [Spirochaetia bacterium]
MASRILESIAIRNFKSIREQTLKLKPLNVFIGGNGSGKSNLIGIFRFLKGVATGDLQTYTGQGGGANSILHFGRRTSPNLSVQLMFREGTLANGYDFELLPTDGDRFVFSFEKVLFHDRAKGHLRPMDYTLGHGHSESKLITSSQPVARYVRKDLSRYRIYHFHDTSEVARVKQTGDLEDNTVLRADAGNLAAFLYRIQKTNPDHFRNIEETIRQIAPFFDHFQLEPSRLSEGKIRLEWKERGSDAYFNASSLSDGTLRFMCLATLFLQPELPEVILIDEPELGLHPAAISLLSDLMQSAATTCQILAATQSVTLVNQFGPEQVWIVERSGQESVFRQLNDTDTSAWLKDYSLGELWEKNVIGGRP